MNLIDKTDKEIIEIANPIWDNLVKTYNIKDYGGFTRDFSSQMLYGANEVELGKQWANNKLLTSLSEEKDRPKEILVSNQEAKSSVFHQLGEDGYGTLFVDHVHYN